MTDDIHICDRLIIDTIEYRELISTVSTLQTSVNILLTIVKFNTSNIVALLDRIKELEAKE